jgi:hypothetical protein
MFKTTAWGNATGDLAFYGKNTNRMILPNGTVSGLLKYNEKINSSSMFDLHFVPYGDRAINFVVSLPEIYEIVIGDGDYRTVTLKVSPGVGQQFQPLLAVGRDKERVSLGHEIKKGSQVGLNIKQELLPSGHLWVQFDISYWPTEINDVVTEPFAYEFNPSPKIHDALYLELGLFRNARDESAIEVEMIDPRVNQVE